jgi:predicted nucleotidyltransferase
MNRERWIAKLEGIVARVEAGQSPARVRAIYVFGSFARGAPEPSDLDLIVVHDPPTDDQLAPFRAAVSGYSYDILDEALKVMRRFDAAVRKVFRRGGERMDILTGSSLDEVLERFQTLARDEVTLVWSEEDRDWQAHIAAIVVDSHAGRFPRNHFIEVKRTAATLADVELVTGLIDERALELERLSLDRIEVRLRPEFGICLDRWKEGCSFGAECLKVLPWALWWLQEQGAKRPRIWGRTELGDEARKYFVQLVRIYPAYVPALFAREQRMKRHCLLPRRRARSHNEAFIFERGPNWPGTYPQVRGR